MRLEESEALDYRSHLQERILSQSASICPDAFYDFTVRGEGVSTIKWNDQMVKDDGMTTLRLRDLAVLLENRILAKGLIH